MRCGPWRHVMQHSCVQAIGADALEAVREGLGGAGGDAELTVLQRLARSSLDPLKRIGAPKTRLHA